MTQMDKFAQTPEEMAEMIRAYAEWYALREFVAKQAAKGFFMPPSVPEVPPPYTPEEMADTIRAYDNWTDLRHFIAEQAAKGRFYP